MTVVVTFAVFLAGMTVTNWKNITAKIPTYYRNCASARTAGAAPISRGSPGYRSKLDEDSDGIACEGFGR
jgi:hypothetical protein